MNNPCWSSLNQASQPADDRERWLWMTSPGILQCFQYAAWDYGVCLCLYPLHLGVIIPTPLYWHAYPRPSEWFQTGEVIIPETQTQGRTKAQQGTNAGLDEKIKMKQTESWKIKVLIYIFFLSALLAPVGIFFFTKLADKTLFLCCSMREERRSVWTFRSASLSSALLLCSLKTRWKCFVICVRTSVSQSAFSAKDYPLIHHQVCLFVHVLFFYCRMRHVEMYQYVKKLYCEEAWSEWLGRW